MNLLLDPAAWVSLITLTVLEIILGVDNIVVLSILSGALPKRDARRARTAGLALALGLRLLLLSTISWITSLTSPVFTISGQDFSWRDIILVGGGLFLMAKAIQEIHAELEGGQHGVSGQRAAAANFRAVITQIALMDVIFSLDSIVTAVGLARDVEVMGLAICIAVAIMYFAAEPVGEFVRRHPTTKMLALCFLILIGVALLADGFGFHIPRGYIYFAMAFAGLVEAFNIRVKSARRSKDAARPAARAGAPNAKRLETGSPGATIAKQAPANRDQTFSPAQSGKKGRQKRMRKR